MEKNILQTLNLGASLKTLRCAHPSLYRASSLFALLFIAMLYPAFIIIEPATTNFAIYLVLALLAFVSLIVVIVKRRKIELYERGIQVCKLFKNYPISYEEIVAIRYRKTKWYMNGVYNGTIHNLEFIPKHEKTVHFTLSRYWEKSNNEIADMLNGILRENSETQLIDWNR
jgi:flagellar biogenesis protein FliO